MKHINLFKAIGRVLLTLGTVLVGLYFIGFEKLPAQFMFIPNIISVITGMCVGRALYLAGVLDRTAAIFSQLEKSEMLALASKNSSSDERFLKDYDDAVPVITALGTEIKNGLYQNWFCSVLCIKIGILGCLIELFMNNDLTMAAYQCGFGLLGHITIQIQTAFIEQKANE